MNLAVSNLLTCGILNPLLMLDGPSSSGSTTTTCAIAEGATALVTTSSVLSVLLIAVDQYLAVVDPLRYRTRIDKLKCGILTISVWFVSVIFGLLAGFNPSPRSVWLLCGIQESSLTAHSTSNYAESSSLNMTNDSSLRVIVNASQDGPDGEFSFTEFAEDLRRVENSTAITQETFAEDIGSVATANLTDFISEDFVITYGFVYALAYALFAYLLPFVGVCWIYVSIYSAAHKNSERTRRTGSRPILSSGSFSEEYYPVRQDLSTEDFRRITKISSLSSIDESIETLTPSQMMPRRGSEFANHHHQQTNLTIEEEESSAIIFTVGSRKVDVTPQQVSLIASRSSYENTKDKNSDNKVPIAVLKAQFLGKSESKRLADDLVKSKFRDEPTQKRKSSHDLMQEEMLRKDLEKLQIRQENSENESSEEEEDEEENDKKDVEIGEPDEPIIERISYQSYVTGNREANDLNEISDDQSTNPSASSSDRDINRDAGISTMNDGQSTRKNSLDDPSNNLPSQSSILKSQHSCLLNGKNNSRYSHGFNKFEASHGMHYDDHIYGKSSTGMDVHGSICGTPSNTPIVTITPPNKPSLHRVSSIRSTSSYINSLKHRISNGSLFKYREETRAARISALVIVMGFICWTPYVTVLVLKNINFLTGINLPHETDIVALSFLILAAYVSPLLFGYRSRRVKRELRKFFCFRKELSYKNNRSLMAKKVLKRRQSGNLSQLEMDARYNIFNCVYGRTKWPKDKVQFVQVPETALVVETCRSSFSSGASTQISSTSTEDC